MLLNFLYLKLNYCEGAELRNELKTPSFHDSFQSAQNSCILHTSSTMTDIHHIIECCYISGNSVSRYGIPRKFVLWWYLVIFKDYSLSAPWSSPAITNSVWGSHWFILHLMKSLARPWAALHEDATSFNRCFKEISTRGLRVNPTAPNGSQDNFSCRIKWIIEILRTNETSNVHFYLVILIILINKNFPRKPDIDKIRKSRNSCWFVILTF